MPSEHFATTRTARATACRQCGKPRTDARPLSLRALCKACGDANAGKAARELAEHSGPAWDEWVRSQIEHARRLAALR